MGHDRFMGIFLGEGRDLDLGHIGWIGDDEVNFFFRDSNRSYDEVLRGFQVMVFHINAGNVEGTG
jgi:hypothetical protein